jgi:hypothetical protein
MKYTAASTILALHLFLVGCSKEFRETETYDLSLRNVKSLLSKELTINELYEKLGTPVTVTKNNYGSIIYPADEGRSIIFSFKGPYVVGAEYRGKSIKGVSHNIFKLQTKYKLLEQQENDALIKYEFEYVINGRSFKDYNELKEYMSKLPKKSVVEYQSTDLNFFPNQPFTSNEQVEDFKIFCEQHGIVLLWYPSG